MQKRKAAATTFVRLVVFGMAPDADLPLVHSLLSKKPVITKPIDEQELATELSYSCQDRDLVFVRVPFAAWATKTDDRRRIEYQCCVSIDVGIYCFGDGSVLNDDATMKENADTIDRTATKAKTDVACPVDIINIFLLDSDDPAVHKKLADWAQKLQTTLGPKIALDKVLCFGPKEISEKLLDALVTKTLARLASKDRVFPSLTTIDLTGSASSVGTGAIPEKVVIDQASGLKVADSNGFSDPYAKVYLAKALGAGDKIQILQTKPKSKTLNPVWKSSDQNEAKVPFAKHPNLNLIIELWDKDMLSSDPLGFCSVPVDQLRVGRLELPVRPMKKEKATGTLTIQLS